MAQAGAHDVRHDVSKTLCFALLCANRIVHPLSNPSKISPFPSHPQQTKRPNTTSPAVHCTPEDTARRIIQNRQQTYKQNLHKCTETSRSKKTSYPKQQVHDSWTHWASGTFEDFNLRWSQAKKLGHGCQRLIGLSVFWKAENRDTAIICHLPKRSSSKGVSFPPRCWKVFRNSSLIVAKCWSTAPSSSG